VTGYLLENRAQQAVGRFAALSALFDAATARHLDALGIGPGARCWEVGAGGPSVPALLADRVGPRGQVVATDLDVGWMSSAPPGVEVRRADVAADEPPGTGFDLVHARLVLVHVPGRDRALRRMAGALRPGGWLLVEDFDVRLQPLACPDPRREEEHRANRVRAGFVDLLGERGADLRFGRTLPRRLREGGLAEVAADAAFPVASPAAAALETANVEQVGEQLVARGRATAAEVDAHLRELAAGRLDVVTPPLVSAWGRRPEDPSCAS
jgi:SAM-dependent methyltransferase